MFLDFQLWDCLVEKESSYGTAMWSQVPYEQSELTVSASFKLRAVFFSQEFNKYGLEMDLYASYTSQAL